MLDLPLSPQSHSSPLPVRSSSLHGPIDYNSATTDQEFSNPCVPEALQRVRRASTIGPEKANASSLSKQTKRKLTLKSTPSPPNQTFRQLLNKPLPALPSNHPIDRTTKEIVIDLEALTNQSLDHRGTPADVSKMSSLACTDLNYVVVNKVMTPKSSPGLLDKVKVRDDQAFKILNLASPSPKERRRASVSTLHSSEETQSNGTRRSGSLLDSSSSVRSGSFANILRGKASLISIRPKNATEQTEEQSEEPTQHNEISLSTSASKADLDKVAEIDTTKSVFQLADQNNAELPSAKKVTDADFRHVAKRLDTVFENRSRVRRPILRVGSNRHQSVFSPEVRDALADHPADSDHAIPDRKLQSLEEALREGPPDPQKPRAHVKKRLLLQAPAVAQAKLINKLNIPLPSPSSKGALFSQLAEQRQNDSRTHGKELSTRARAFSLSHDEEMSVAPSAVAHAPVHYQIASPISPLARIKPTENLQKDTEGSFEPRDQTPLATTIGKHNASPNVVNHTNLPQTRPRAATSPSCPQTHDRAKDFIEESQIEHGRITCFQDVKLKSSTWAYGDRLRSSRSSILPQRTQHNAREPQHDSESISLMPKTPKRHGPFALAFSDSIPSLQAGDSTLSFTDAPTPVTVIRVDSFDSCPNSPGVIRISPFPDLCASSDHTSDLAIDPRILTYESLASHVATLELGSPPPIPPRHPARTAETSDSPSAKPKRGHIRLVSRDQDGQPLDVLTIRADAARFASTHPIPSPKYIEITSAPLPSSSSIVQQQPLENPFVLHRSVSTHSIGGHPPIGSKRSNRASQASAESSRGFLPNTFPPTSSGNSSSQLGRTTNEDFPTDYTSAIDSIMLELDEMRTKFSHLKSRSTDTSSSSSSDNSTVAPDIQRKDTSKRVRESETSVEQQNDVFTTPQKDMTNHITFCCNGDADNDGGKQHWEDCEYWKATESEFGEIRSPPPPILTPPTRTPAPTPTKMRSFGFGAEVVSRARGKGKGRGWDDDDSSSSGSGGGGGGGVKIWASPKIRREKSQQVVLLSRPEGPWCWGS